MNIDGKGPPARMIETNTFVLNKTIAVVYCSTFEEITKRIKIASAVNTFLPILVSLLGLFDRNRKYG